MIMLKHNTSHEEHIKVIIMTRQIYMYISLVRKFRKVQIKLPKFQEQ